MKAHLLLALSIFALGLAACQPQDKYADESRARMADSPQPQSRPGHVLCKPGIEDVFTSTQIQIEMYGVGEDPQSLTEAFNACRDFEAIVGNSQCFTETGYPISYENLREICEYVAKKNEERNNKLKSDQSN